MIQTVGTLLTLLKTAPDAGRLLATIHRAANGDPEALEYIRREGVYEALDLVRPGAGETGRQVVKQLQDAALAIQDTLFGNVIEGQYRVIDDEERYPWSGFVKRVIAQRFGGHVVLGPMGQGKTSLAKTLAWHWRRRHGYRVECIGLYGDDRPNWAVSIGMKTLIRRMAQLRKYLDTQTVRDPDELDIEDEEDEEYCRLPATPPEGKKIILIDEAGIMISTHGTDKGRKACMTALTQCRHIDWIVLYLGQTASQIPEQVLAQTVKWVKQPAGDEGDTDRNNSMVRNLWRKAGEAFAELKRSPYYAPPHADPRAWVYCDCRSLNGIAAGYTGLVPFVPAPNVDEEGVD